MSLDQFLLSSDTTDLDYPEIRPTLDLNFARVKALDPRITFTRSSGGSYYGADGLIKLAGVNEARFDHDPYTGESLGLLVEESRTNLLTFSGIPSANWNANNSAVLTNNSSTSPDGTTNATQIAGAALTGSGIFRTFSLTSGTAYTYSLFVKAVSGSNTMYFGTDAGTNATVQVNTFTGVASLESGSPTNITSTSYPNGWYRISFTFTASVTAVHSFVIYNLTTNANTWLAWGAQIEVGAFPTSYIPTEGSTRTRAADNASITGKNFSDFYNSSEFTMRCIFSRFSNNSPPYTLAITSSAAGGGGNLPSIRIRTDGNRSVQAQAVSKENISVYNNNVSTVFDINQPCNAAIAVKSGDTIYSDSGKLAPVSNVTGSFDGATTLHMGRINGILNGHIRNVTYYPKRLPNAQLQALTR